MKRIIVWLRNELRVHDQLALYHAATDASEVLPVFIVDERYYSFSPAKRELIAQALYTMQQSLKNIGGDVLILKGDPERLIPELAEKYQVEAVYSTRQFEPKARTLDATVKQHIEASGKRWAEFQDHLLFAPEIVKTSSGTPFLVFTAFKNACKHHLQELAPPLPSLKKLKTPKLERSDVTQGIFKGSRILNPMQELELFLGHGLQEYHTNRDIPSLDGTSRLSHHLSIGSISIRTVYDEVNRKAETIRGLEKLGPQTFVNELLWREFFYHIMYHFPHVLTSSFKEEYDRIEWVHNDDLFRAWCEGRTGYPIIDAAMRQLNTEYWMHNRARMIVASFLTKDLHIDWRKGEEYFMSKLLDGDIALNNAGWQWSAGTGTDAQPWFRIFNPVLQGKKFDANGAYIRKYLPELRNVPNMFVHEPWLMPKEVQRHTGCIVGKDYPLPVVVHEEEKKRTMELYKAIKVKSYSMKF